MSRSLALLLITVLVLSSSVMVGSAFAQPIPKPSVPEFTIKFVNASYLETTTNPYTGLDETELISNNLIEIAITKQLFDYSGYKIYYNVRVKPHFGDDWTELYPVKNRTSSRIGDSMFSYAEYINEHSVRQSISSYTNIVFPVVPTGRYSELGYDVIKTYPGKDRIEYDAFLRAIPEDSQLDFQVEALVGHYFQVWIIDHPFYPWIGGHFEQAVAYDETSGWSNTQTVTIGETKTPSPEPTMTPTPTEEPQQTEQEIIIGVAIAVAVIVVGIGLLIYFKKRKH